MASLCEFAVLRLAPDAARGEAVNLGIVVFKADGLDVHVGEVLTRARVVYPELDDQGLSGHLAMLRQLGAAKLPTAELHRAMSRIGPFSLGELSHFHVDDQFSYEAQVANLLAMFVKPQRSAAGRLARTSRLVTSVRKVFRGEKLLAGVGDAAAIDDHKIVPEWPLPSRPSLKADFALKNRLMRVCEVVELDLTQEGPPPAALFSGVVTLDVAQRELKAEQCVFAYRANGSAARIDEALGIAQLHASKLVNWDAQRERQDFIDEWISAAQAPQAMLA